MSASQPRSRYPRSIAFTREDHALFFGREKELKKLYDLLQIKKMLILFSASGMGKSSLINAGLIPMLEKRMDVEHTMPIPVRFFYYDQKLDNHPRALVNKIITQLRQHRQNLSIAELPLVSDIHKETLWYELKLFAINNFKVILILDQSEEIFDYPKDHVTTLKDELYDIYSGVPQQVDEQCTEQVTMLASSLQNEQQLMQLDKEVEFIYADMNTKVLMAIRKDKLGLFNAFTDYFPDMLKDSYELLPMQAEQAANAIESPAAVQGNFLSNNFFYAPETLALLLDKLQDKDKPGTYDPFTIQITCRFIENRVIIDQRKSVVGPSDIPRDILEDTWKDIPGSFRKDILKERVETELIEHHRRSRVAAYEKSRWIKPVNQGKAPSVADYEAIAIPYIDAIKRFYEKKGSFQVSDVVLDVEENGQPLKLQFVNLVQEGGGVLGVALVGYTYVLEELGIRFLKLAGTSAGAINTMLMAAVNRKEHKKSAIILEILANKNLFDFVDGHWLARKLIKMFVRRGDSLKKLLRFIIGVGITLIGLYLLNLYLLGRNPFDGFAQALMMITSMFFLLAIGIGFLTRHLFKRFVRNGYGINPGRNLTDWISSILQDPQYGPRIFTLKDLKKHLLEVPNFYHREGGDVSDLKVPKDGDEFITLISSDITSQMKVEFPKMWKLYWDNASKVNPADFVRASMSIPVFFEVFRINDIPIEKVRGEWERALNMAPPAQPPSRAMFVDGGVISNFPINIFFNRNLEKPRLPTFGVLLEDVMFQPKEKFNSLGDFIFSIFNTVRFHYDKDFLVKHNDFEKTIGRIDVREFNWLNFNIEGKEKLRLFKKGVEAATEFLIGTDEVLKIPGNEVDPKFACREAFNWQEYRDGRPDVIRKLHKDSPGMKSTQQSSTTVV